jgi:GNAT superfamily N-acetyltransferase
MRGMSLNAADFRFEKWKELGQKLSASFLFTTLKEELKADVNTIDKLAQLYKVARHDWPSPDPSWQGDNSPDDLRAPFVRIKYPEHFSIIKAGNEYIGFTSARNRATGTAVHPDYRNLGLATYLKALDLNRCIDDGEEYFESATANPAMQRVNEKLGYRLNGLAEVRFVKAVGLA